MSNEQEKIKLWKTYGILMSVMLGGAVLILGAQAAWNSIQQQSVKSPDTSPTLSLEPKPANTVNTVQPTQQVSSPNASLSQQDAVNRIKQYLQAKARIFAPPFDRQLASSVTTGAIYSDMVKSGGSLDWLQQNNSYYQYGKQEVVPTGYFNFSDKQAEIDVRITEYYNFYTNGRLDQSDTSDKEYRFTLKLENGSWKLAERQLKN